MKSVDNTIALDAVDPAKFDAVFCVGGHGPMFDLPDNETLEKAVRTIYEKGGIASAVCHGPAGKWAFNAGMLKLIMLTAHYGNWQIKAATMVFLCCQCLCPVLEYSSFSE